MSTATSESPTQRPAQVFVLGVGVSAITLDSAVQFIESWILRRPRRANYVCITGVHGIVESRHDRRLRDIHNEAGLVTPDGMPLVFMAHRLGYKTVSRVYGPDLMRRLTELSAAKGYRQFYYGGAPGVAEQLVATLKSRHPELQVAGSLTPPFRVLTLAEDAAVVDRINAAAADIVWVGLSTPKQEFWMASHAARLNAAVLIGVGAAFDFLAGTKSQAPAWMQQSGLEWFYRLACEPRRLWKRYSRIVPYFLLFASLQLLRARILEPSGKRGNEKSVGGTSEARQFTPSGPL
jgi:N-acetylglucosaminyldiphosphoundecaprenol N-acetyl-beta-D-mannosaminyltransferase